MNEETVSRIHWSFWIINLVALIWNIMGTINFSIQMSADSVASYPETHRAIIEGRPVWATAGFALAVFSGTLGCLLLLLRKSAAVYLFIASLIGVIVTMGHTIKVAGSESNFSPFEISMMILMPIIVAAFLIWYSKLTKRKAWIG